MPHKNDPETFGDLHLKMKVDLPKKLTLKQVETIKEILTLGEVEKDDL